MRFGDVDLILDVVPLRFWGSGQLARQQRDLVLVLLESVRRLFLALGQRLGSRCKCGRIFLRVPERVEKRQIDFVIPHLQHFMRERLFFGSGRKRRHPLGCFQGTLVDLPAPRRGRAGLCVPRLLGCTARLSSPNQPRNHSG